MISVLDVRARAAAWLAGLAMLAAACGDDGGGRQHLDSAGQSCVSRSDGWCLYIVDGKPLNAIDLTLGGVSGTSPSDVIAVGWTNSDAAILRFDGTSWQASS